MEKKITQLEPSVLWKHFYNLTQIPRPSGHEAAVIEHIKQFAIQEKLEYIVDKTGNILVRKPATKGREGAKGVILQSHVDMVPQKNSDKKHDFLTDPIEAKIDGEWVKANDTTLGADNGIGVAAALSVLQSDNIKHGAIEALFTISEETGMDGAFGLQKDMLKGKILMNLDSEEEGEIYIGCAGGVNVNTEFEYAQHKPGDGKALKISVKGLKGGHSGLDINLGRANANKLMAELLFLLQLKYTIKLSAWQGGNLRNAIPREAEVIVVIDANQEEEIKKAVAKWQQEKNQQYAGIENNIQLIVEPAEMVDNIIDSNVQKRIVDLLKTCLNGVIKMSEVVEGVVQTSNNLSIVNIAGGKAEIRMLLRSSVDADRAFYGKQIAEHFNPIHAKTELAGDYPGWQPNSKSVALQLAKNTYQNMYGKIPEVKVIHAGLECGIIGGNYPGLDMISFGPTIKHPHSPDEKVHIASVLKFWDFLKGMLESVS